MSVELDIKITANDLTELWDMLSAFGPGLRQTGGAGSVGMSGPQVNLDPPQATKPKRGRPTREEAAAKTTAANGDDSKRLGEVVNELTTIFMQARNDNERDTTDLIVSGRDELGLKKLAEAKPEHLEKLEDLLEAVKRVALEGSSIGSTDL